MKHLFSAFFLILICNGFITLNGQQVNSKILELRAESVANIRSMISGRTIEDVPSLHFIERSIQESTNPEIFYEYVLNAEKAKIIKKFEKLGVSFNDVKKRRLEEEKKDCEEVAKKKKIFEEPSLELRDKMSKVFALFSDKPVSIIPEKGNSPAQATDKTLLVDESRLKRYKKAYEQEAIFAHECVHHIEKHCSEEGIFEDLLYEKYGKITPLMQKYLNELSRCNETIADIKGALRGGFEFVTGLEGFTLRILKKEHRKNLHIEVIDVRHRTHPSVYHRFEQSQILKEELALLAEVKEQSSQKKRKLEDLSS